MPELFRVVVNDKDVLIEAGTTVAAVLLQAADPCRISSIGEPRSALCGMGICFECRATVDGITHRHTCQLLCREGMRVETMR